MTAVIERVRERPRLAATAVLVLASLGAVAAPPVHTPLLQRVGSVLVVDEPVTTADVIVVAIDSEREGVLEAADLYHRGVAPLVAYFEEPLSPSERELLRRGLPDPRDDKLRDLHALGVPSAERIPEAVTGTREQGAALPRWAASRGFRSVVVVTQTDHSRRVRRVLDRTMDGHPATVTIRTSRYSEFDPDTWFQTERGIRVGVEELLKLGGDLVAGGWWLVAGG